MQHLKQATTGSTVTSKNTWQTAILALAATVTLGACSSKPEVTRLQELSESVEAPFEKYLVITLFDSFDARRYLEEETVKFLAELGTVGIPSTSMMNTKTPLVAQTFIDMVDEIDADAVLLTQLASHDVQEYARDARPERTINLYPTYYFNVWAIETTEYVEPPRLELEHDLVLKTEVLSVATREPVWAIDSRSQIVEVQEDGLDYSIFVNEANAIVTSLSKDGLIK